MLAKVEALGLETTPVPGPSPDLELPIKPIEHYMLFWYHRPDHWADWDWRGARLYIEKFSPTAGFSAEEARFAKYVTIVGGPAGVPAEVETTLRSAGCKVERVAGATEAETRQILEDMATSGQRFKSIE